MSRVKSKLNALTSQYNLPFYLQYLAKWPEYFETVEAPCGQVMGYSVFLILYIFPKLVGILILQLWGKPKEEVKTGMAMSLLLRLPLVCVPDPLSVL